MKITIYLLLLAILLIFAPPKKGQQSTNDFKSFWSKFKAAVIANDKNTVATLSKFPIGMSYGIRSIKTKTEFMRRYREVFNQQTDAAKCFARKEPDQEDNNPRRFSIYCPNEGGDEVVMFAFERGRTGWRFVALDNINE